MNAHAAPNAIDASSASGITTQPGRKSSPRQISVTPRPARYICPSPPMLNRPAWNAAATARPVKMKLVV
ncbi:hypothetical protein D3C85_1436130 [compost metagenome]